jgi:hypothetical protein
MIGFIALLKLVTTINYTAFAKSHNLLLTMAHTMSPMSALLSRVYPLFSNCSHIVACLHSRYLAMDVSTEPFPSNGCRSAYMPQYVVLGSYVVLRYGRCKAVRLIDGYLCIWIFSVLGVYCAVVAFSCTGYFLFVACFPMYLVLD